MKMIRRANRTLSSQVSILLAVRSWRAVSANPSCSLDAFELSHRSTKPYKSGDPKSTRPTEAAATFPVDRARSNHACAFGNEFHRKESRTDLHIVRKLDRESGSAARAHNRQRFRSITV